MGNSRIHPTSSRRSRRNKRLWRLQLCFHEKKQRWLIQPFLSHISPNLPIHSLSAPLESLRNSCNYQYHTQLASKNFQMTFNLFEPNTLNFLPFSSDKNLTIQKPSNNPPPSSPSKEPSHQRDKDSSILSDSSQKYKKVSTFSSKHKQLCFNQKL